ncbi:hypothetical protein THAOC_04715 [Thalassiosira oceanica]|uniref:Uncharacterized protein n=1 Tax=Thalassiosira oceanica TaxID=159749 RepID=K0T7V3_THAOC|nr:hypothetical protein THAOC_04715 [Thalassiosira oceanica]|eukprot:EJK73650.1 hypothetical protein THAOC_04715 [Thalassiosira oceanica]
MLLKKKKQWIELNGGDGMKNPSVELSPLPYSGTPIDDAKYEKLSGLFLSGESEVERAPRSTSGRRGLDSIGSLEKSNGALKMMSETLTHAARVSVLLTGSLSLGLMQVIEGTWVQSNSNGTASRQKFQLKCDTADSENATSPQGGFFRGSFTLPRAINDRFNWDGKTETVIEDEVKLTFSCTESGRQYIVKGSGSNELGVFEVFGIAVKVAGKEQSFDIKLRKTYVVPTQAGEAGAEPKKQAPPVKHSIPSKENVANGVSTCPRAGASKSTTQKSVPPVAPTHASKARAAKRSKERSELMGRRAPSLTGKIIKFNST